MSTSCRRAHVPVVVLARAGERPVPHRVQLQLLLELPREFEILLLAPRLLLGLALLRLPPVLSLRVVLALFLLMQLSCHDLVLLLLQKLLITLIGLRLHASHLLLGLE